MNPYLIPPIQLCKNKKGKFSLYLFILELFFNFVMLIIEFLIGLILGSIFTFIPFGLIIFSVEGINYIFGVSWSIPYKMLILIILSIITFVIAIKWIIEEHEIE